MAHMLLGCRLRRPAITGPCRATRSAGPQGVPGHKEYCQYDSQYLAGPDPGDPLTLESRRPWRFSCKIK
jgi:hypothetical protein